MPAIIAIFILYKISTPYSVSTTEGNDNEASGTSALEGYHKISK